MATRSTIALEYADGTVEQVYCHWDGYLAHNGKILFEHYSNPFILRDLIDMGEISSLGKIVGTKHAFSQFRAKDEELSDEENARLDAEVKASYEAAQAAGMTTFYARDRGEELRVRKFASFEDYKANHQYEEYEYILRNVNGVATWFVSKYDGPYVSLEQALIEEEVAEEN